MSSIENLPPEFHTLQVTSPFAIQGPYTEALRLVTEPNGNIDIGAILVAPRQPAVPIDPVVGGQITFPGIPGAALGLEPNGIQFDEGVPSELSLTLLPLNHLPFPQNTFVAVAAAEIAPDRVTFTQPIEVTLPNQAQLLVGSTDLLISCLNKESLQYEILSQSGRVSQDGLTVTGSTSRSAGPCPAVVFFH